MRVVDVADEFGLTSAEALDVCARALIPAQDGATELTNADVEAFRAVVTAPPPAPPPPLPGAALGGWVNDPEPAAGCADATRPVGASTGPSRANLPAVAAIVCAFLPLTGLYFGYAVILLVAPTFVLARMADRNVRRFPGRAKFSNLAVVARFTSVLIMFAVFASIVLYNVGAIDARPDDWLADRLTGRPTSSSSVNHIVLLPGDCIVSGTRTGRSRTSDGVTKVACREPHDAEVIRTFTFESVQAESGLTLPATIDPASPQLTAAIVRACQPDVDALMGATLTMDLLALTPTPQAWAAGDTSVSCAVGGAGGVQMRGSVTGSP